MRVTVDDIIEDQELARKFSGVKVLVDGVRHEHVVVADQEQGYIEKHKQDSDGSFALSEDKSMVLTEIIKGNVEFVFGELGL